MPTITCPNCGAQLAERTRFCSECGARQPEMPAEQPKTAVEQPSPTVRLDIPSAGAPTVLIPPDAGGEGEKAPSPTVRLDIPDAGAPTVLIPPDAGGEGERAAPLSPTVRLDGPSSSAPSPAPPQAPSGFQPTLLVPPLGTPPPVEQVPSSMAAEPVVASQQPSSSASSAPPWGVPAAPALPPNASPAAGGQKRLWWILGGVGCLGVVLLVACAGLVLTTLGRTTSALVATAVPTSATAPQAGAGGLVPGDSPLTGGSVLLRDDFGDPDASDFGADEDETAHYAFEDGAYVVEVKEPETLIWSMVNGSYENVSVEFDSEVPPSADETAVGLIFHYQDNDNFYLFSVSNEGYYALELLENNEWTTLIDWTQSDAIDAVRNHLLVKIDGERIGLYVNNTLLEETSDDSFTEGEIGIAVSSFKGSPATVSFDNLVIANNN